MKYLQHITAFMPYDDNEELTKRALRLSLMQCEFEVVCSLRTQFLSKVDYDRYMTAGFPVKDIHTSHVLVMQYDGYVIDGSRWDSDWLNYDYIGAPWPWHPAGRQVGNGGFSLRSKRLMCAVKELALRWDVKNLSSPPPDDDMICHVMREQLEREGFIFAPVEVADKFSYERSPPHPTFGFHGIFNFPNLMSWKEFQTLEFADYVKKSPEYEEAVKKFQGVD